MKRIAVMLLCLCMVLPMMLAMAFSAGATTAAVTISTDKEIYNVGDAIKLSVQGATTGWVGIVPADAEGDPITDYGGLYWKYVKDLNDTSITTGKPMGTSNANALATGLGIADGAALLSVPAGDYFAFYVSNESLGLPGAVKAGDVIYEPFTVANKFHLEKNAFTYGEPINVTPVAGSGTDWIGISPVSDDGTINRSTRYIYIDTTKGGKGVGISNDIREGIVNGNAAEPIKHLPAGRYVLYFVPNNGAFANRDKSTEVYIDILGATVEKTEFKYGEPIMVKGYGAEKDWVGIGVAPKAGEKVSTSIRWRYVVTDSSNASEKGLGSGVAFDIREAKLTSGGVSMADIPAGEYVIFTTYHNSASEASPYTYIPITVTIDEPEQPTEVKYELDDKRTGLAGGKLTVTFADSAMEMYKKATNVALFWGDAEGNALEGFGEICSRKVTGTTTVIELTDSMVIPEGAKQLMVYAHNGAGRSAAVGAALPADRGYRVTGDKVTSFQIVSDMHVGRTNTDGEGDVMSEKHANMMFADIMALDPDSVGIFVAGDAADHGQVAEYERLFELWAAANANGLKPQLYIGVGNHEMMKDTSGHNYSSDYAAQMDRFLTYANKSLAEAEKTATPYYYVNRGGQHFIFLATEYCGTHAYLSDAQLTWLESKLEAVAADGAPVFIMLHQPLYNTIAGGLANEDGSKRQGWHGVIAGDENMEAWEALVAEKGKGTSDHGLMYGQYEAPLRNILKKYPSAMMFSGHSHWIMQSVGNIYEATEAQPNYMFNTASVSYLWTDNDELYGGTGMGPGSQGYFVTVYENCIEFRGRDFRNGEWIPGAYYRVWLDCAHEYGHDCATICKWCGETRADAPAEHVQDTVCTDDECNVCGEKVTLQPHKGVATCATVCVHGCGTVLTPDVEHETDHDCDPVCKNCNEAVEHKEHEAVAACATVCRYGCGTPMTATADHATDHDCDAACKNCGEAVAHAEHAGIAACATVCRYGCGTPVTATADHVTDHDCDAVCKNCNEAVAHAEHAGIAACATVCRYGCGTPMTATVDHATDHDCDAVCKNCNEAVAHAEHAGIAACATVCRYGCGTEVPHTAEHEGLVGCSTVCKNCNEVFRETDAHESAHVCSTTCMHCGEPLEPQEEHTVAKPCTENVCSVCQEEADEVPHQGEFDCSESCKWCGEAIADPADHQREKPCTDEECSVCEKELETVAHEGAHSCSESCRWCGTPVEALAAHTAKPCTDAACTVCGAEIAFAEHAGGHPCSTTCKYGCGTAIAPTADHSTLYECDASCRTCGEAVPHVAHVGKKACSTTCMYGCGTVLTAAEGHIGLHECSSVCKYCGEPKEPESAHSVHVVCRDTACVLCGEEVTPTPHVGQYACSTVCRYGCGRAIEPISEHDFGEWEVIAQPTATAEGVRQHKCSACGKTEKEKIGATGVGTDSTPDADGNGQNADKKGEVSDRVVMISIVAGTAVVALGAMSSILIVRIKKKKGR